MSEHTNRMALYGYRLRRYVLEAMITRKTQLQDIVALYGQERFYALERIHSLEDDKQFWKDAVGEMSLLNAKAHDEIIGARKEAAAQMARVRAKILNARSLNDDFEVSELLTKIYEETS